MQLLSDLKYSLRLLRKAPAFSATLLLVIVLSLSLYIAGYSLGAVVGSEPMPYPKGEDYITLRSRDAVTGGNIGRQEHDAYLLNRVAETSDNYVAIGGFNRGNIVLSDGEYAENYTGYSISVDLFLGLATNPILGRNFTLDDALVGAPKVVLISHVVWQSYYNGAGNVVDNISLVNGVPHTIIGVMPEGFEFLSSAKLWIPLPITEAIQPGEGLPLTLVAVLKDGSSYNDAESEFTAILEREGAAYPDNYAHRVAMVHNYADGFAGEDIAPNPFFVANSVTLLILLVAVVNLSSMLFIRFTERKQELIVRSSLGASGWQLSGQIMLESFIICFIGLLLSLGLSSYLLDLFNTSLQEQGLNVSNTGLNFQGVLAGVVSILAIWLMSCTLVSIKAFKSNPGDLLGSSNKGNSAGSVNFTTRFIVGFELILSCFLLVCCAALIYLSNIAVNTDYGAKSDGLAVAFLSLSSAEYDDEENRILYAENMQSRILEIPGVQSVAMTSALPQRRGALGTYSTNEITLGPDQQAPEQMTIWASNSYFSTIDVDILQGRDFDSTDVASNNKITILSASFAQRLWPNESPIGKQIQTTVNNEVDSLRVVGVVSDLVQGRTNLLNAQPSLYRPMSQNPPRNLSIAIRHQPQLDAGVLALELKKMALEVDRNIPLLEINTLEDQIVNDQEGIGTFGNVFAMFALVTLVLAAMGIYSVMARSILFRTHEIGVRRALGSSNFSITWKFVKQGLRFLLLSTVVGGGLASLLIVFSARSLGLTNLDFVPVAVALVTLIMMCVVLTATYLPSQKAIAMEPGDALRYE